MRKSTRISSSVPDYPGVGRVDTDLRHLTTDADQLVAEIHDRMPLIFAACDYLRWLSDEPDPSNLPRAEPTRMWPISTRFNKLENDDPSVAAPIEPCAAGS
jgi:putative SOS response-associated peptidase YedK